MEVFGASETQAKNVGSKMMPVESKRLEWLMAPAWESLGEEEAAAALAKGRAMSLEEALDYAMQETGD